MAPRAGIIVTGTEVLTGRVADRNGPWLAEQLRAAGIDVAQVIVVGDRRTDLRDALHFFVESGAELIITSGGLGPTADDLTAEVVADFQGHPMHFDAELEAHIAGIVERISRNRGWRMDPAATAAATRKQAMVPEGATPLPPVGTAPGLVVPAVGDGPPVVVLPGPPGELQGMWPAVLADPSVQAATSGRSELRQATIRLWGPPESELSATLRRHEDELDGLEITTCLRSGELEVVSRYAPDAQPAQDRLAAALTADFGDQLFAPDGSSIDEIVAALLLERSLTIATTESCTAGLLAGRLTDLAGSSAYVLGGLVTYSNETKSALAGVPAELIEALGAVSAEVAVAMADGARSRLGADIGVGITGVAGPGGGTGDKPVGLVHLCVSGPGGILAREIRVPGSRSDVRQRTVIVALHMIRTLLTRRPADPTP